MRNKQLKLTLCIVVSFDASLPIGSSMCSITKITYFDSNSFSRWLLSLDERERARRGNKVPQIPYKRLTDSLLRFFASRTWNKISNGYIVSAIDVWTCECTNSQSGHSFDSLRFSPSASPSALSYVDMIGNCEYVDLHCNERDHVNYYRSCERCARIAWIEQLNANQFEWHKIWISYVRQMERVCVWRRGDVDVWNDVDEIIDIASRITIKRTNMLHHYLHSISFFLGKEAK